MLWRGREWGRNEGRREGERDLGREGEEGKGGRKRGREIDREGVGEYLMSIPKWISLPFIASGLVVDQRQTEVDLHTLPQDGPSHQDTGDKV